MEAEKKQAITVTWVRGDSDFHNGSHNGDEKKWKYRGHCLNIYFIGLPNGGKSKAKRGIHE